MKRITFLLFRGLRLRDLASLRLFAIFLVFGSWSSGVGVGSNFMIPSDLAFFIFASFFLYFFPIPFYPLISFTQH